MMTCPSLGKRLSLIILTLNRTAGCRRFDEGMRTGAETSLDSQRPSAGIVAYLIRSHGTNIYSHYAAEIWLP